MLRKTIATCWKQTQSPHVIWTAKQCSLRKDCLTGEVTFENREVTPSFASEQAGSEELSAC